MKRSRQESRLQHRLPPAWFHERHAIEPTDFVENSDRSIERDQIGAGAKQNVLAIVHHFASTRMFVGRRTTTEEWTPLEECDAKTTVGKCAGRGKSGQSTTNDRHLGLASTLGHQRIRCRKPRLRIFSFSQTLRLTLRVKTS